MSFARYEDHIWGYDGDEHAVSRAVARIRRRIAELEPLDGPVDRAAVLAIIAEEFPGDEPRTSD